MTQHVSRRDLLRAGTAIGVATLHNRPLFNTLAAIRASGTAIPGAPRPVLHLIGYGHIDAPWLWPWRDAADAVFTTWQSAVDRMRETPGFSFIASSIRYYQWVQRSDPRLFAEITRRVHEGRWEPVNGWIVEPDCNTPSTESFIRQGLLGKRYLKEVFGYDATVGFNADSFGHAWGLPTILAETGFKYYAFMRPEDGYNPTNLPKLFWWEGPDGARILAWRIQGTYVAEPAAAKGAPMDFFPPGFDHGAMVFGVGNHGGGPTKQELASAVAMAHDPTMPVELRFSTFASFFAAVERSPAIANIPVVRSDLAHIFRGCYSANGTVKWLNRRAERQLMTAETLSSLAALHLGWTYPTAAYNQAWLEVCFNQFHDALAGSAMHSTYIDGRDGYGVAGSLATETTVAVTQALSRRVDMSRVREGAVLCFNPLPWPRTAVLTVQLDGDGPTAALKGADGALTPLQQFHDTDGNVYQPSVARIDMPACGYRVFELSRDAAPAPVTAQPAPDRSPSRFTFSENGGSGLIASFKASDGTELLTAPIGFVVVEDMSDAWGPDGPPSYNTNASPAFDKELGRLTLTSTTLRETGPVRRLWVQRATWRSSQITVEVSETTGSDLIDVDVFADWHEPHQILMLEIPTVLAAETHIAKVPGASIVRQNTGNEEPGQDWVAFQGTVHGAEYAVALLNAQTYSYNCRAGRLRTVIVRSAPWSRDREHTRGMDTGYSVRRFGLIGNPGSYTALGLERRALEFQTPLEYMVDSVHPGTEPWERSFLEITPANVSVTAIKEAEDHPVLIVRVQETSGLSTAATITSPLVGWAHTVALKPWEITTVAIERPKDRGSVMSIVDALERPRHQRG